jgi:ATP-dependent Lhr-like helicase
MDTAEFHPGVAKWFADNFAAPTQVQSLSWPRIAAGEHLLITAPTGSGKTLTAFLWSLNRFANGELASGATRVLYISPLKALNNDIQRNLLMPLAALGEAGVLPELRVQTRSGDTSQSDRQRMLRRPPEILITTPESLFLLLTNRRGAQALASVETVIIDEIHSIVDSRRGVQLMTSLERLADVAGEFQRIALSATVAPLEAVADYVGGIDAMGRKRKLAIVEAPGNKALEFHVRFPQAAKTAADNGQPIWDPLAESFRQHIDANTSTLFFTNSRSLAEKVTYKLNEDLPGPLAYAHHGSLARDIRTAVERRLKAGELKAIVATSSLEMGIDIGDLDEVVLVQSPGSVAATLQRIGRAGHRVGETSIGSLYPTHAVDFIEAAALADAVAERDIEPLTVMTGALDVLAQIIVSCCAHQPWSVDGLFALITRSSPYRRLERSQFELVLEMLAGRYAGSRVRELKARVHYDRIAQTIKAHKSALFALYNAGGTIPDRGYYKLRHAESGAELGELDEEFVWEAKLGQVFSLGTQNWQVAKITHNDVLVRQAKANVLAPPFWRSEVINRSFHFSERITQFLEDSEVQLTEHQGKALRQSLIEQRGFDDVAADELLAFLKKQREVTGSSLPHRHHLLIEQVQTGPGGYKGPDDLAHLVIHTFWGGQLNRPWALAIEAAWQGRFGHDPEIHADNNAISIQLRGSVDAAAVLGLVTSDNLLALLRSSLEGSGFFGARFRECAGRALLLTRQRFDQRLPLWMSRLQAKKLMTNVAEYTDFPVLLEAWRTCLDDEFDLPALHQMLDELHDGVIRWTSITTRTPSPLASNLTFDAISRYMYADDTPDKAGQSSLSQELIQNALNNAHLRPKIVAHIAEQFVRKRQRLEQGYQPTTSEEWHDYLKDRILVPESECTSELLEQAGGDWLVRGKRRWLAHPESMPALKASGWFDDSMELLDRNLPDIEDNRTSRQLALEILSFYGPCSSAEIDQLLPELPAALLEDDALICGELLESDTQVRYCDRDNFESLLRLQRAHHRPLVEPKPQRALSPFLAAWQGFGRSLADSALDDCLSQLRGYPASARLWLADLYHARFSEFSDHHLERAFADNEMVWFGTGREQLAFGYPEDMELLTDSSDASGITELFTDPGARYGFLQLLDKQSRPDKQSDGAEAFNARFWQAVWNSEVYSDSVSALRQGSLASYSLSARPSRTTSNRPTRRAAGRLGSSWPGNWLLRPHTDPDADPLTALEDNKERARILLDRYGLLCRELANREGGPVRWAKLARALFAMELAGEVVAGYFFSGLSGPQFMTPAGLQSFQHRSFDSSYWLNATDPASPCGLGAADDRLPARRVQNLLSYHAGELALTIENSGRRLNFHVAADHPACDEICQPLVYLARTLRRLTVETINGDNAADSVYLAALGRVLTLRRVHRQIHFEVR